MSAKAGWYPDPGGGQGLYRYWDGKAWSAATSPNPASPPPTQGIIGGPSTPGGSFGQGGYAQGYGQGGYAQGYGQGAGQGYGQAGSAYANYQQVQKKKSPVGWWVGGGALVIVIVIVAVIAIRAVMGGGNGISTNPGGGPATQDVCPAEKTETADPGGRPNDGRVHGGPVSYPELGSPWGPPQGDTRVPFGSDVQSQIVEVEPNYQPGSSWVASVLVGELQAGDGFFSPEQGSQIVVKCILGKFYGNNPVQSNVKVNEKATIDGREAWIVESQLTFDIAGLETKGELLIVAIISAGTTSGLYYASIPDTTPELVQPARDALAALEVDG